MWLRHLLCQTTCSSWLQLLDQPRSQRHLLVVGQMSTVVTWLLIKHVKLTKAAPIMLKAFLNGDPTWTLGSGGHPWD